jgi:predicted nucleic acid-binding protein
MSLTPTSRVIIDSWSWLELFAGSDRGKEVEAKLQTNQESFTTAMTLAEVVSVAARRGRPTDDKVSGIRNLSKVIVPSSLDDIIETGILHAQTRKISPNFSLADAFVLQAARKLGAKVLTGDPDFKGIGEAEFLT